MPLSLRSPLAVSGPQPRLVALDGARALSALFVACFHIDWNVWPARGYLAVDLFFLLSGYVIAAAYEKRLKEGGSTGWFIGVRMARLYPLYLFGTFLGLVGYLTTHPSTGVLTAALRAMAFLPSHIPDDPTAYPLNGAMWSLAAEVFVNVLYAWVGARLPNRALTWLVLGAGAVLALLITVSGGSNIGSKYGALEFLAAAARVLFAFPLGVLVFRLHNSGRLPKISRSHALFLLVTGAVYSTPILISSSANALIDIIFALGVLPVIFVGLVGADPVGSRLARAYGWAGGVSYALYAVHPPLADFVGIILKRHAAFVPIRALLIALPVSLALATFGHYVIENRGRRLIMRLLSWSPGPASPAGAAEPTRVPEA